MLPVTIRITAVRKVASDERYDRALDMFEATYETMTPIDEDNGSRVYLIDAADGASAIQRMSSMLDRAHIAGWGDHISGFRTRAA
jgi:hypothetical protein